MLGANGAGKTTLMRAIAGLHRRCVRRDLLATATTAERSAPSSVVRAGLVLVPEGRQVFPELRVLDNIRLGAFPQSATSEPEIEAVLARFPRLRERLHQRGGPALRRRAADAGDRARPYGARRVSSCSTSPRSASRPRSSRDVFEALAELRGDGMTLLVVDQMADYALALADRAYVIDAGHIRAAGAENPELVKAYLGTGAA